MGGGDERAQPAPQADPARGQAEQAGPAIIRIDAPIDRACRFERIDQLPRRHGIAADPEREPALIDARFFLERGEHRVLQRVDATGLCYLGENAEADLMKAASQMRGNAMRRRHTHRGTGSFIGALHRQGLGYIR